MECKAFKLSKKKLASATRQASKDLAKKMSLEPRLISRLNRMFKEIAKESKSYYLLTGTILPLSSYRLELTAILTSHYLRVYKSFSGNMRQYSKSYLPYKFIETKQDGDAPNDKDVDAKIDEIMKEQALQDSIERADKQSYYIMNTTEKQLSESYFEAQSESMEIGTEKSREEISSKATDLFNDKSKSRPETIAVTETQAVAEDAKLKEANVVAYTISAESSGAIEVSPAEAFNPLEGQDLTSLSGYTLKYWVTMGDERVRDAHIEAEGQVVFADEPFVVMGEDLMCPGDTSLGASDANICNCRCTAVYEFIE